MNYTSPTCRTGLLAMLALGALAVLPARADWQFDALDYVQGGLTAPPALAFDGQDCPHIAYGASTNILHVRGNSGGAFPNWDRTRATGVTTTGVGQVYLAATGNGEAYLAYRPYTKTPAIIPAKYFTGTTWQAYSVPQTSKGSAAGVVTDSAGKPYWLINTEMTTDAGLGANTPGYYLTSKTATGNTATAVAAPFGGATYLDNTVYPYTVSPDAPLRQGGQAIVDRDGNLHTVQYYEMAGTGYLAYAKGPLGGPFTVDRYADPTWQDKVGRPSIAVDTTGNAHIAYSSLWPNYGVRYATWNGSGWDGEWIEQGSASGYAGTFPQVLVGSDGAAHVIYADLLHGLLKHAVKEDGSWHIEAIDTIGTQAAKGLLSGSLAASMDSRGGIGVAYFDGAEWLKYAYLVPEPASLLLAAVAGIGAMRRRRGA